MITFPEDLRSQMDCLSAAKGHDLRVLKQAAMHLRHQYKNASSSSFMQSEEDYLVYLQTRMPATYAVLLTILRELQSLSLDIQSVLDLGAGPGVSLWALRESGLPLSTITLVEADQKFIDYGQKLVPPKAFPFQYLWQGGDMRKIAFRHHDMVMMSYSLGELNKREQEDLIKKAWKSTNKCLILIEPGTPKGFNRISHWRQMLIEKNAYIAAPCGHQGQCPLKEQKNWCHFSVKLHRSKQHQYLKDATLGYEEEKYSYLIALKEEKPISSSRVIFPPLRRSGHIILDVCTEDGIRRKNISKKDRLTYKEMRRVSWGDTVNPSINFKEDQT